MKILEIEQGSETWKELRNKFIKRLTLCDNSCIEWNRKFKPNGYGNCGSGFPDQNAHRTSYLIFIGEIPIGLCVLHKCDNKKCCNPDHLYLGTIKDNVRDAIERGLWPIGKNKKKGLMGEKNNKAKLSNIDVLNIRKEYIPYKNSAKKISQKYKVHESTIEKILKGQLWQHV